MHGLPGLDQMKAAREGLRPFVMHTPLIPTSEHGLFLKPEIHQVIHSFKIRGVLHAVLSLREDERSRGIRTVSAGNTAQALAFAGKLLGIQALSVMPETAPLTKIEAVKRWGGTPVLVKREEVFRYLQEHLWEHDPEAFIHPWTDPRVIEGHASIGLEILEDLLETQAVFVPVGGGALIAGVGAAIKSQAPEVKIIGVEPEGCPALFQSLEKGEPTSVECQTICDGVAVPYITEEMFPWLQELVDEVILVSEPSVKRAMRDLALEHKMIVEASGALSFAAARSNSARFDLSRSVALITGGSVDQDLLLSVLSAPPDSSHRG